MAKQFYKAVYFSDYPSEDSKDKSVTLAFSEPEEPYYSKVKDLTTQEIKELIGIQIYKQLSLLPRNQERSINQVVNDSSSKNYLKLTKLKGLQKRM
ncbi:MAG: hypothetical protein IPI23_09380 [Bacteroidetes bacterium]|nr:hypothetical protein [Bacteroidota bacterium]